MQFPSRASNSRACFHGRFRATPTKQFADVHYQATNQPPLSLSYAERQGERERASDCRRMSDTRSHLQRHVYTIRFRFGAGVGRHFLTIKSHGACENARARPCYMVVHIASVGKFINQSATRRVCMLHASMNMNVRARASGARACIRKVQPSTQPLRRPPRTSLLRC